MGTQDLCPALQPWSRAEPNQLSEGSRALTGVLGTAGQGRGRFGTAGGVGGQQASLQGEGSSVEEPGI